MGKEPGKGRGKREVSSSAHNDYYHGSGNVVDREGEHRSGVRRQDRQGFLMYSRDLESDGGSGFDDGDNGQGLSFAASW